MTMVMTTRLLLGTAVLFACAEPRAPKHVAFGAPELLLPDPSDAETPITTANLRAQVLFHDDRPDLLVADPLVGITVVTDCDTTCRTIVLDHLGSPVRAHVVDLDRDGDRDILVADIGSLQSAETEQGRILLLQNDGNFSFQTKVLAEGLGRTACAETADFDGDGDIDVVGCVFGHLSGEVIWLEQQDGHFTKHTIDPRPGAIHAFPFDADGDGDMDIVASIAQLEEQVALYRNDGKGNFTKEVLVQGTHSCYGMSGLELSDLDDDGDIDILASNGDFMDRQCQQSSYTKTYKTLHGLDWLENDGHGRFERHDIARFYGAYAVRAADLDEDGDRDVVLAAYRDPSYADLTLDPSTIIWLENRGGTDFLRHDIKNTPSVVITIELADIDRDGDPDLLAGSMETESLSEGAHRLALMRVQTRP